MHVTFSLLAWVNYYLKSVAKPRVSVHVSLMMKLVNKKGWQNFHSSIIGTGYMNFSIGNIFYIILHNSTQFLILIFFFSRFFHLPNVLSKEELAYTVHEDNADKVKQHGSCLYYDVDLRGEAVHCYLILIFN